MTVRLVDDSCAAEAAAAFAGADRLAVDTEFHTEGRWLPALYLVQVHVPGGETWVLDPLMPSSIAAVADALIGTPWVVHAGFQDLRLLKRALGGLPTEVADTQIAAGLAGERYPASLTALAKRWLGVAIDKRDRMSDWSKRPLDPAQLAYAADDVAFLPDLFDAAAGYAADLGHGDAVGAACREARDQAAAPPTPGAEWRRAIGGSSLQPRELLALRQLVTWRDAEAIRRDKPPHFVLGDTTLRTLARDLPRDLDQLGRNRKLSDRTLSRYGKAIVTAIDEACATDLADAPRVASPASPEARQVAWLQALAAGLAATRGLAPRLVLPAERLETIVLHDAPGIDAVAPALGPWRDALVGDVVRAALRGEISLRLVDGDVAIVPPSRAS